MTKVLFPSDTNLQSFLSALEDSGSHPVYAVCEQHMYVEFTELDINPVSHAADLIHEYGGYICPKQY